MRTLSLFSLIAIFAFAGALVAPAAEENKVDTEVKDAIQLFKKTDSKIQNLFDTAYGYVVFPSVGKGAVVIGGAAGDGEVFEKGTLIGTAKLTQITVGAQLGGQEYAEVVFFETKDALDQFKSNKWAMSAQVSAVAAAEGASANAKYRQGVLVFTIAKAGLMFEASVGGQKFKFTPINEK
jgi:lipid-binding SYLF domain-containing protein